MPASPPLAICMLGRHDLPSGRHDLAMKNQTTAMPLLVFSLVFPRAVCPYMKSFLRGNLALADGRLISLVHPLRIFHTFFPNESRQERINVGP